MRFYEEGQKKNERKNFEPMMAAYKPNMCFLFCKFIGRNDYICVLLCLYLCLCGSLRISVCVYVYAYAFTVRSLYNITLTRQ